MKKKWILLLREGKRRKQKGKEKKKVTTTSQHENDILPVILTSKTNLNYIDIYIIYYSYRVMDL